MGEAEVISGASGSGFSVFLLIAFMLAVVWYMFAPRAIRVVGGSFGTKGIAKLTDEGLYLNGGVRQVTAKPSDVVSAEVRQDKERRFSVLSLLFGLLIITPIFTIVFGLVLLGPVGFIIGIVMSFAWSFYSGTNYYCDLVFQSGDKITVQGSQKQLNKVLRFVG